MSVSPRCVSRGSTIIHEYSPNPVPVPPPSYGPSTPASAIPVAPMHSQRHSLYQTPMSLTVPVGSGTVRQRRGTGLGQSRMTTTLPSRESDHHNSFNPTHSPPLSSTHYENHSLAQLNLVRGTPTRLKDTLSSTDFKLGLIQSKEWLRQKLNAPHSNSQDLLSGLVLITNHLVEGALCTTPEEPSRRSLFRDEKVMEDSIEAKLLRRVNALEGALEKMQQENRYLIEALVRDGTRARAFASKTEGRAATLAHANAFSEPGKAGFGEKFKWEELQWAMEAALESVRHGRPSDPTQHKTWEKISVALAHLVKSGQESATLSPRHASPNEREGTRRPCEAGLEGSEKKSGSEWVKTMVERLNYRLEVLEAVSPFSISRLRFRLPVLGFDVEPAVIEPPKLEITSSLSPSSEENTQLLATSGAVSGNVVKRRGVRVTAVTHRCAASLQGLQVKDELLSLNGIELYTELTGLEKGEASFKQGGGGLLYVVLDELLREDRAARMALLQQHYRSLAKKNRCQPDSDAVMKASAPSPVSDAVLMEVFEKPFVLTFQVLSVCSSEYLRSSDKADLSFPTNAAKEKSNPWLLKLEVNNPPHGA